MVALGWAAGIGVDRVGRRVASTVGGSSAGLHMPGAANLEKHGVNPGAGFGGQPALGRGHAVAVLASDGDAAPGAWSSW